jgi:glycosyltransferase involved in cell wall biosynthesis
MKEGPLVSIVTPSFNMGGFIEETIRSVLDQDYPNIEYLVVDGGSTDGTLDILKRYEGRLKFVSEPDRGHTDAVNKGFQWSRGSIFTFLNADDTFLPGAVTAGVQALADHPEAGVVYGDAWFIAEDGSRTAAYPVEPFDAKKFERRCFICQPAAFIRREVYSSSGMLDPERHNALDYDLWIRIAQRYPMKKIDKFLANSRIHQGSKTVYQMGSAILAGIEVLQHHYGYVPYNWLYGYCHYRLTGQPLAIERPRPSALSACLSIAFGVRYNWRYPLRYCRDIISTAKEGLASARRG